MATKTWEITTKGCERVVMNADGIVLGTEFMYLYIGDECCATFYQPQKIVMIGCIVNNSGD